METQANQDWGKVGAAQHERFIGAYHITVSDRGTHVSPSPDGRTTGTCDRCGTAIMHVYVFQSSEGARTTMHVGIDCAQKMGVPVEELRAARRYWGEVARESSRAAARASAEDRAALREAERRARLAEAAALVEEIDALAAHPHATDYERSALGRVRVAISEEGGEWLEGDLSAEQVETFNCDRYDSNAHWRTRQRVALQSVRDRLSLTETSVEQGEDLDRKGKPAGLRRKLRAYRAPVSFEGTYGVTHVSFLTDDRGNAFVHKGSSHCYRYGETVEATWSVAGSDERDGLTATVLKRPRKFAE
jgi:hypothetical protein